MTSALRPSEHSEQCALFDRAAAHHAKYPELRLLFAIPNSGAGAQKGRAGWLKAEGVRKGVPDLCLPVARGPYHGCFVEMKVGRNKLSAEQSAWLVDLSESGYRVIVAYGQDEAWDRLMEYLSL